MDEIERQVVATGGCQCGAVRYATYAAPEGSVCHCRMCQKATGGLFAALAKVDKADLVWTRGEPASFRSSPAAWRDFCAACGTPLTFRFVDAVHMEVTIGSLDHPELAPPKLNFGAESRLPWIALLKHSGSTTSVCPTALLTISLKSFYWDLTAIRSMSIRAW